VGTIILFDDFRFITGAQDHPSESLLLQVTDEPAKKRLVTDFGHGFR
jgi:hypothetical protein